MPQKTSLACSSAAWSACTSTAANSVGVVGTADSGTGVSGTSAGNIGTSGKGGYAGVQGTGGSYGGILTGTHGLGLPAGRTITGTGTIEGSVGNSGAVVATGAEGLTFAGTVSGLGQGITGTRITFAPTGGLFGAGTIAAAVVKEPPFSRTSLTPVLRAWSSRKRMAASKRVSLLADRSGTEQTEDRRTMAFIVLPEKGRKVVAGIGQMRIAIAEEGLTASLQHAIDGGEACVDIALVLIAYDHLT